MAKDKTPLVSPFENPFLAARQLRRKGHDKAAVARTLTELGLEAERVEIVCNTVFFKRLARKGLWQRLTR